MLARRRFARGELRAYEGETRPARSRRHSAVLFGGALAMAASGAAALAVASATPALAARHATKAPWVIGSVIDATGADATGGAAQRQGMTYFLNQLNASGGIRGRQVRVRYCDSQSTPSGGAQCAQELSNVNSHVVLLQGDDDSARAAEPYLTKDLAVAVDPVLLPAAGTTVFQGDGLYTVMTAELAKNLRASHIHTLGMLYTTDTSGEHQLEAVQAAMKAAGITVVTESQNPSATDVTPQLVQLHSQGAQAIFLGSIGTVTEAEISSYATLNMNIPIITSADAVTNAFLHSLPKVPARLYGISQLVVTFKGLPKSVVKSFKSFLPSFKKQFHSPADTQNVSSNYVGCIAAQALKAAGPSAKAMSNYLRKHAVRCFGSTLRFNTPGLNVVSGQPVSVSHASRIPAKGWLPIVGRM